MSHTRLRIAVTVGGTAMFAAGCFILGRVMARGGPMWLANIGCALVLAGCLLSTALVI